MGARYERASASASTSTARIPNRSYPHLWTLASHPHPHPQAHRGSEMSRYLDSEEGMSGPSDGLSESEDDEDEERGYDDDDGDDLIFVSRASSSTTMLTSGSSGLRRRRSAVGVPRMVTTARGQPCAGETETELDEFVSR